MRLIPLESELEGKDMAFTTGKQILERSGFVLGGNWDYDHGCFDRPLDDKRQVWLRLPFTVTSGMLDAEQEAQDTMIRFGTPYVLRHLYQEGLDDEVSSMTGGMLNQFQDPVDADAPLAPHWRQTAEQALHEAEEKLRGGWE